MDELVKDFLLEGNEILHRLDKELVQLESDPSSKDLTRVNDVSSNIATAEEEQSATTKTAHFG